MNRTLKRRLLAAFVLSLANLAYSPLLSQPNKYFFYHHYDYGSEALFNPISVFLNGGGDTFQLLDPETRPSTFEGIPWKNGSTSVWRSITAPFPVINAFGWNRFLTQEVFPTNVDINRTQYVPNYMLHLVGGGMVSRKLTEWYDYYGFPAPFAFAAITSMTYEFFNEVVENGYDIYPNEDCIPDILLFQTGGILLFSSDAVCDFFSETLNLNDWSQPVGISFKPFALRNPGQNFVMKVALNRMKTISLFFHFGNFAILGLSLKTNSEDAISFGAGLASTGQKNLAVQNGVPSNTVSTGMMAGVYYDRTNSLLASVVYSEVPNNRFRLNLYPGPFSLFNLSPGFFVTVGDNGLNTGLTMEFLPVALVSYSPR